ncbi:hypothetical protein CPB84DRAFT_1790103 [Gymnopilus junonius]|uniref:Uncharacterized protein n=1 Tax=Gymnopilus junonius TaxID=109634 RepID=A0A9P5NG34_GYMJU|nr:hypothetical protein CPB84DRAFT_1790103 [Gymnopilus junonius]
MPATGNLIKKRDPSSDIRALVVYIVYLHQPAKSRALFAHFFDGANTSHEKIVQMGLPHFRNSWSADEATESKEFITKWEGFTEELTKGWEHNLKLIGIALSVCTGLLQIFGLDLGNLLHTVLSLFLFVASFLFQGMLAEHFRGHMRNVRRAATWRTLLSPDIRLGVLWNDWVMVSLPDVYAVWGGVSLFLQFALLATTARKGEPISSPVNPEVYKVFLCVFVLSGLWAYWRTWMTLMISKCELDNKWDECNTQQVGNNPEGKTSQFQLNHNILTFHSS